METNGAAAPVPTDAAPIGSNGHALQNASNGVSPELVAPAAPARAEPLNEPKVASDAPPPVPQAPALEQPAEPSPPAAPLAAPPAAPPAAVQVAAAAPPAPPAAVPAAPPAAPPALEVRAYTFGAGPLGLVLLDRDRGMGGVLVHDIDAGGQGANLGVPPHSLIVAVNEQDVSGLTRSSLVGMIKASGRPLTLKMQVPAGSAPAAASGGKWAQQMRELVEMGFADAAANLRALEVADGNVGDAAIQLSESLL